MNTCTNMKSNFYQYSGAESIPGSSGPLRFAESSQIPLHCPSNCQVFVKIQNCYGDQMFNLGIHLIFVINICLNLCCRSSPFFGLLFAVFVFYISVTILSVLLIVFSIWFQIDILRGKIKKFTTISIFFWQNTFLLNIVKKQCSSEIGFSA